jgi:hypothetical protein
MPIFDDVLSWARERPWWQQKLLTQLATGGGDIAEECKAVAEQLLVGVPTAAPGGWLGASGIPPILRVTRSPLLGSTTSEREYVG